MQNDDANAEFVIWLIECRTGCTCCYDENHRRGPYKTREDAERRMQYFLSADAKFRPVASRFARRGLYDIERHTVTVIDGKYVTDEDDVYDQIKFVNVHADGTVDNNNAEQFD